MPKPKQPQPSKAGHTLSPREPRLCVVKAGKVMFWPLPGHPIRAYEGDCIREDDPFVNVVGYPNQAYKLRPLTELEQRSGRVILKVKRPGHPPEDAAFQAKIAPCNRLRMHREYVDRGLDWMPLADMTVKSVSTMTPEESGLRELMEGAEPDFDVPPVVSAPRQDVPETE